MKRTYLKLTNTTSSVSDQNCPLYADEFVPPVLKPFAWRGSVRTEAGCQGEYRPLPRTLLLTATVDPYEHRLQRLADLRLRPHTERQAVLGRVLSHTAEL